METIAVVADGTPASSTALQRAVGMVREAGGTLLGIFVLDAGWVDFIGHDWQSSRNARQGFLDYVRACQERDADAARAQFEAAATGIDDARFALLTGDPAETLSALLDRERPGALVLGRHALRACGRPSAKRLIRALQARAGRRVIVV